MAPAERALRYPVIWIQLRFGTQIDSGNRFVEILLTVAETYRQQGRNVLQYLKDALTAQNQTGPSLLPNRA